MGKGFRAENQQLDAWLDKIEARTLASTTSVSTIRAIINGIESDIKDIEEVVDGDIDGGFAASVFTDDEVIDGGGA